MFVLNQYDERLQKLDLPALKQLSEAVFEMKTPAEFEAMLKGLETGKKLSS